MRWPPFISHFSHFGAEHELVIYPREKHSFTERAHKIDALERIRSWFTHWLGQPAAGRQA